MGLEQGPPWGGRQGGGSAKRRQTRGQDSRPGPEGRQGRDKEVTEEPRASGQGDPVAGGATEEARHRLCPQGGALPAAVCSVHPVCSVPLGRPSGPLPPRRARATLAAVGPLTAQGAEGSAHVWRCWAQPRPGVLLEMRGVTPELLPSGLGLQSPQRSPRTGLQEDATVWTTPAGCRQWAPRRCFLGWWGASHPLCPKPWPASPLLSPGPCSRAHGPCPLPSPPAPATGRLPPTSFSPGPCPLCALPR